MHYTNKISRFDVTKASTLLDRTGLQAMHIKERVRECMACMACIDDSR
jgi:polyferredoxin